MAAPFRNQTQMATLTSAFAYVRPCVCVCVCVCVFVVCGVFNVYTEHPPNNKHPPTHTGSCCNRRRSHAAAR